MYHSAPTRIYFDVGTSLPALFGCSVYLPRFRWYIPLRLCIKCIFLISGCRQARVQQHPIWRCKCPLDPLFAIFLLRFGTLRNSCHWMITYDWLAAFSILVRWYRYTPSFRNLEDSMWFSQSITCLLRGNFHPTGRSRSAGSCMFFPLLPVLPSISFGCAQSRLIWYSAYNCSLPSSYFCWISF